MAALSDKGVNILFVYGDPGYYGRFGFKQDTARPFKAPYPLEYAFGWQALKLNPFDNEINPCEISCVNALSYPQLW